MEGHEEDPFVCKLLYRRSACLRLSHCSCWPPPGAWALLAALLRTALTDTVQECHNWFVAIYLAISDMAGALIYSVIVVLHARFTCT